MKLKDILAELLDIANKSGIAVRKEKGNFKGGYCVVNEQEMIVINKQATIETQSSMIARSLTPRVIESGYIKPVIREFIEKERQPEPAEVLEIK